MKVQLSISVDRKVANELSYIGKFSRVGPEVIAAQIVEDDLLPKLEQRAPAKPKRQIVQRRERIEPSAAEVAHVQHTMITQPPPTKHIKIKPDVREPKPKKPKRLADLEDRNVIHRRARFVLSVLVRDFPEGITIPDLAVVTDEGQSTLYQSMGFLEDRGAAEIGHGGKRALTWKATEIGKTYDATHAYHR